MRASAEAQGGEFGRTELGEECEQPAAISAHHSGECGLQAGISPEVQEGELGEECEQPAAISANHSGECELQAGISPEQQRELWLARAVQRGWLRTSVPAPELEAVVPVRGGSQLRADAGVFTPRVVLESGAQPQDGEEAVVGTVETT